MRGFFLRLGVALTTLAVAGLGLAATVTFVAPHVYDFLTAVDSGPRPPIDFGDLDTRSVVYAADGSVLAVLHAEQNRVPVALDQVPEHVVTAVLDAEDERFWEHGALDLRSLTRALVSNLESGVVLEGGSTITQQLVKTALLSPERDLGRKIEEAFLAIRVSEKMSKAEILERYLNTVYFGNGAYGLQAAAERYFGTDVGSITLSQGVLLASLIRNPVGADPWVYPDQAVARRDAVLQRMEFLGHVAPEEATAVRESALPEPPPPKPVQATDYFVETVKQQLFDDPRFGLGEDTDTRVARVFRGGLHIETTLDPSFQRVAEAKVAEVLPDSAGQFTAALVSVDVKTGAVRALVGGSDFSTEKFNLVTQGGRQTGSSFKTLTLVAGLESGYLPNDRVSGVGPCRIPNPGGEDDPWEVKNSEGSGGSLMTLTDATVYSVNCAYARLMKLVGPAKLIDVAQRMGITTELPRALSLTLGAASVSPLEMASVYATLAADGIHHAPYFVTKITDHTGAVIYQAQASNVRAISAQHARTVTDVLTQVVTEGTGGAAAVPRWTVAGKTGSTDDNTDAWFVGYTPELATAVWMGSPEGRVPMTNVGGIRVYGGTYPARIWGAYMRELVADRDPVPFLPPAVQATRQARTLVIDGERAFIYPSPAATTPTTLPIDAGAPGPGGRGPKVSIPSMDDIIPAPVQNLPSVRPRDRPVTGVSPPSTLDLDELLG